jgi:hypothetical protein
MVTLSTLELAQSIAPTGAQRRVESIAGHPHGFKRIWEDDQQRFQAASQRESKRALRRQTFRFSLHLLTVHGTRDTWREQGAAANPRPLWSHTAELYLNNTPRRRLTPDATAERSDTPMA